MQSAVSAFAALSNQSISGYLLILFGILEFKKCIKSSTRIIMEICEQWIV